MSFVASYLKLSSEEFGSKIKECKEILQECTLCPRECRVNRTKGEKGFCKTTDRLFISSWGPHFGEERPLVGYYGSGTIFFGYCNLGCIYCQNYTISHLGEGDYFSPTTLAEIMLGLQKIGCHNINLVTPTHQMPAILESLKIAKESGLYVPIVYNCGGYESLRLLKILDGIIDIYMPDFKYSDPEMGIKYSKAPDYPKIAKAALVEMHRQVGDLFIDNFGIAKRGLLVRHLILPNNIAGTEEFVRFIAEEISKKTYVNIMDQYRPCYKANEYPEINRRITSKEYKDAIKMAHDVGLRRLD
ncbi:MAG: radical SAM protein [Thermodesulfovibrionales bacterium]|nr:radical SAM protein [Thermodesulfovibrionales bacterium]